MPRTHLGLKWVIFSARSPPNKTSLAGGAVRRLSRQTLTRLPLRDVDRISKIWLYFEKFWVFLATFFPPFFYFNFLPLQLAKRCETTIVGFLFQRAFVWYATWWGANVNQGPKNVKNTFTLQKVTWYMLKWKKITFSSLTFLFVDRFQKFKGQKYLIFNSPWFCICW